MNNSLKFGLLTLVIGAAVATTSASATVVDMGTMANAPAICQAFTPGITNTIRNRVIGSENVGPPIAIACDFVKPFSESDSNVIAVQLYFSNNNASGASANVNCTMLTGFQGESGAIAINKSVSIDPQGRGETILFDSNDTPDTTDRDLGNTLVGINCTLPKGVAINDTYLLYEDENGVGV